MATKSELILALEQIEREKGVKKDDILKMIEAAVASSLRRHVGKNAVIEAAIDPMTGGFSASVVKKVVEAVADHEIEMTLADAQSYKKDAALGDEIRIPAPIADFARIAAQTAKQVLTQKIREAERDSLYDQYKPRQGEILSGAVHRFLERNIIIDLGRTEAILPLREQIRRERYNVGASLRAVILRVDKAQHSPQIVLSRAAPLFLRRLLEMEVPEIMEKIVEIIEIARDPGFRAKVSVKSNDPKVDPVGSCVGLRGSRIRSIMNELSGEKIDLIPYDDDVTVYLKHALSPAKALSVRILDAANKKAEALVAEDQMPLAIGKEGQNLSLALKLTGWDISVKIGTPPASAKSAPAAAADQDDPIRNLESVGPKTADILKKAAITTIDQLAAAKVEDLTALEGIGEKTAAKIIASAQKALAEASAKP